MYKFMHNILSLFSPKFLLNNHVKMLNVLHHFVNTYLFTFEINESDAFLSELLT